jgi:hypothetical protein
MTDWIDTLVITEEPSKDKFGKLCTIFYIREKPFRSGYSYQSTATSENSAKWVIAELKKDRVMRELKDKVDDLENAVQKVEDCFIEYHKKYPSEWLKYSVAWRMNQMNRNPSMNIIHGFSESDMKSFEKRGISRSVLKKTCFLAAARATQYKAKGEHNIAASWLSIAAILYGKIHV